VVALLVVTPRTLPVLSAASVTHLLPGICLSLACAPPQLDDGSAPNVTLENVFVLKSRDSGLVVGVKGGYYFAAKYKSDPRSDPSLAVAAALANGFYWAVGAFSRSAALSAVSHVIAPQPFLSQRRMCKPNHRLVSLACCPLCAGPDA
jgi:hypothetical protein